MKYAIGRAIQMANIIDAAVRSETNYNDKYTRRPIFRQVNCVLQLLPECPVRRMQKTMHLCAFILPGFTLPFPESVWVLN